MRARSHVTGLPGWHRTLATCLAISFGIVTALDCPRTAAQTAPPSAAASPAAAGTGESRLDQPQLEQLLAPVALYPDTLLTFVLMAATYPLEVVQAQRWLGRGGNAKLSGNALAQALQVQSWDESVKSLVPFPDVLKLMSDQLEWTEQVGDAVLAQQKDVLNAVQVLRGRAQKAGKLQSGPQLTVTVSQNAASAGPAKTPAPASGATGGSLASDAVAPPPEIIIIAPTQPDRVYVPVYNPAVVYGIWPYPAYLPPYYPPPPSYPAASALLTGVAFVTGIALVGSAWGWANPSWSNGNINVNRVTNINGGQIGGIQNNWQHNTAHRQGVAYRSESVRNQYQPDRANRTAARDEFRGRTQQGGGGGAFGGGDRGALGNRGGAANARPGVGAGAAGGLTPRASQQPVRPGAGGAAGGARQAGNRPAAAGGRRAGAGQLPNGRPAIGGQGGRQLADNGPQGFQGIGQGADARAAGQRGQASRQSAGSSPVGGGRGGAQAGRGQLGGGAGGARSSAVGGGGTRANSGGLGGGRASIGTGKGGGGRRGR